MNQGHCNHRSTCRKERVEDIHDPDSRVLKFILHIVGAEHVEVPQRTPNRSCKEIIEKLLHSGDFWKDICELPCQKETDRDETPKEQEA